MDATAGEHPLLAGGICHPPDRVGVDPCGIHHNLRLPALALPACVFADRSAEPAAVVGFQRHDSRAGAYDRARLFRSQCHQEVEARVIKLPVAVGHPPRDVVSKGGKGMTQLLA